MKSITSVVVLASLVAALASGCYAGRSRNAKAAAYIGNGVLITGGVIGLAEANGDEAPEVRVISAVPLLVGLIGVVINAAVETRESTPALALAPLAKQTSRAATTTSVTIDACALCRSSLPLSQSLLSPDRR